MAPPFLQNPVELGDRSLWGSLRMERVFTDWSDLLAFSDDTLYECYSFSSEGIQYICKLVEPYMSNAPKPSHTPTVAQTVYVALSFFATGIYMHPHGDAENLSKNTVCHAICKVVLALTELLNMFVVFLGHLPTLTIKEDFYKITGCIHQ